MNEELFKAFEALTFDDVLIVPGYTEVLPDQAEVSAQFTRQLPLVDDRRELPDALSLHLLRIVLHSLSSSAQRSGVNPRARSARWVQRLVRRRRAQPTALAPTPPQCRR